MLTGSIPPTGIPMPFISAGGTSLSVCMGQLEYYAMWGKVKKVVENLRKASLS